MSASLRVYFDDSGTDSNKTDFCAVAGVMAKASQWRSFLPRWREALSESPSISHFKMNEAASLRGEFTGWKPSDRDNKVTLLTDVLVSHALCHVVSIVPKITLRYVMRKSSLPLELEHPYLPCFVSSLELVSAEVKRLGICSQASLVLDHQDKHLEKKASAIFAQIKVAPKGTQWHEVGKRLGSIAFCCDRRQAPAIQAADLVAWHYRTAPFELNRGRRTRPVFNRIARLPLLARPWDVNVMWRWRHDLERMVREADKLEMAQ